MERSLRVWSATLARKGVRNVEEVTHSGETISESTIEQITNPLVSVEPVMLPLRGLDETTSSMMTPESLQKLGSYIVSSLKGNGAPKKRSLRDSRARNAKWYARKRARSNGFEIEYELVFYDLVYFRDSGKCGICGKDVEFDLGTLDHIIPVTKGGSHTYDNVQLAHQPCNREKADHEPSIHNGREGNLSSSL